MKAIQQYEQACNDILQAFIEKQGFDWYYDGWIGEIGSIAGFSEQYFFNIEDMVLDLKTNQPKGLILEWQNAGTDWNMFLDEPCWINYQSWIDGKRYD